MSGTTNKYADVSFGTAEAVFNKLGGVEGIKRFLSGLTAVVAAVLRKITTVPVKGVKQFVAKDQLQAASVGFMGLGFKKLLLNKVEENVGDATLAVHRFEKNPPDVLIVAELGNRAEIQLAHFFELLKKQAKTGDGPLSTGGCANIAYVKDINGNLCAVSAYWCTLDYWDIQAHSVGSPFRWDGGRVLSRG